MDRKSCSMTSSGSPRANRSVRVRVGAGLGAVAEVSDELETGDDDGGEDGGDEREHHGGLLSASLSFCPSPSQATGQLLPRSPARGSPCRRAGLRSPPRG